VRHDAITRALRDFHQGVTSTAPILRAYAPLAKAGGLELKEDGTVIVRGTATTPTPDRYGDIVEPLGAKFDLPLVLLWQHMASQPVGHVTAADVDPNGIKFAAEIPKPTKSAALIARYQEAVESMELGLVRATSIGFRPLQDGLEVIDRERWTFRFTKWEWLELSLVTIPANAEATIDNIKHFASAGFPATAQGVTRLDESFVRRYTHKTATFLKN
jgi:uncharacterized protein